MSAEGRKKLGKQIGGRDCGYAQIDDMFPGFREILQKIIRIWSIRTALS